VASAVDPERLVARLVERGVIHERPVEVERLSGGVSADVYLVTAGTERVVAKLALAKLRVAQDWRASTRRVLREAEAMTYARRIRPDNVPEILDVDDERLVLTMRAAPADVANWKVELLSGRAGARLLPRALGVALADWHSASSNDPAARERFEEATNFVELRISPFFDRIAEVHPDLAGWIGNVVARMRARTRCLVHGDFSPKNVLFDEDGFWVLDWETAHWGDPTFDAAFLVSHLVCKALHRPADAGAYRADADAFIEAYLGRTRLDVDDADLVAQIGCLVLARVDGKSPVDYLDARQQDAARSFGRAALRGPDTLERMWSRLG
jgi:aminoglycoside phosphotransferase (APT) family kinase protein